MASSDEEITRLYRIQRTIMQMLNDRGYIVADHELNMTKQQFLSRYGEYLKRDALSIQKTKRNDSSEQVFLKLCTFLMTNNTGISKYPLLFCLNSKTSNWRFYSVADICFLP